MSPVKKSIFTNQQKHLQEILRRLRIDAGLRQADLAKRLGQPQSFVSKYESGERRLDLVELRRICIAVGISLNDLIGKFESRLK